MKSLLRIAIVFLVSSLLLTPSTSGKVAFPFNQPGTNELFYPPFIASYHVGSSLGTSGDERGGIREDIPAKYLGRYAAWKQEFLATEVGRNQFTSYQNNSRFTLTITTSRDNPEGATTGNYKWNAAGELIAATITLGTRLDAGYPNPIYFPVMNSLGQGESAYRVDRNTLAATKIAHEFGHVNRTAKIDPELYQLQGQLIPQYNKIFLSNGRNAKDPRLLDLARQLGGTPVEIWEDREYWGEANAMVYLRDRFAENSLRCTLFNKIRHSVDLYAKSYEKRFLEIAQATPSTCGWK